MGLCFVSQRSAAAAQCACTVGGPWQGSWEPASGRAATAGAIALACWSRCRCRAQVRNACGWGCQFCIWHCCERRLQRVVGAWEKGPQPMEPGARPRESCQAWPPFLSLRAWGGGE